MASAGIATPTRRPPATAWWRDPVRVAKPVVLAVGCVPLAVLAHAVVFDPLSLGANPAERILHETGDWCLQFLLITLAVTPLRRITGWNWPIRFRRMLGLFAFAYGVLHLAAYVAFDQYFDVAGIVEDIWKRPFITVGFVALVLMTPLAITSTKGWIRRLGGERWNRLHKAVYLVTILGVVHYWWLVKRDITWPVVYALVLALLLGYRLFRARRGRPARARA
jgi:sulfoxide reductase heme-binding subunit YedZ